MALVRGSFFLAFWSLRAPSGEPKTIKIVVQSHENKGSPFCKKCVPGAAFGAFLDHFGRLLDDIGRLLDDFGRLLEHFGAPGRSLGLSWAPPGSPKDPNGRQKEQRNGVLHRSGRPGAPKRGKDAQQTSRIRPRG